MDNPVDHVVDLGLVNYVKHPENPNYIVFRFADHDRANSFETLLTADEIWFEKSSEEGRTKKVYILYGIHKNDYNRVTKINYQVEATHKKPFIPHRGWRYGLIVGSTIVMTLAIMGYCHQKESNQLINKDDLKIIETNLSE